MPSGSAASATPLKEADSKISHQTVLPDPGEPGGAVPATPQAPGDEKWVDGFGPNGVNGFVRAFVADESGNVFIGGDFFAAGSVAAANIAKWDGTNWSSLGGGLDNTVYALTYDPVNHRLYAGGAFHYVCDTPDCAAKSLHVNHIAMWSGGAWHPLGDAGTGVNGVNGDVYALALDENYALYVGGNLGGYCTNADCSQLSLTYYVAKWTWVPGGQWAALGSNGNVGVNGSVAALAWSGTGSKGTLYVGGSFNTAGGGTVTANYVAAYTCSTNFWSALVWNGMNGVNQGVSALALDSVNAWLYIGGAFSYICGNAACSTAGTWVNYITRWDLGTMGWSYATMGAGGWCSLNDRVEALALDANQNLLVGGDFTAFNSVYPGGTPVSHIVQWNGSWSALGSGTNDRVWALLATGNSAIAGGYFWMASGAVTTGIARWNGANWSALRTGNGVGQPLSWYAANAIAVDGKGNVYLGGGFLTAGGVRVNRVAKWDGTHWSALGNGLSHLVVALATDKAGNLYAGGYFQNVCADASCAPGTRVNGIARWDPVSHTWSALGNGLVSAVHALALDRDGNLYAGGFLAGICNNVDCSNSTPIHGLARWDHATGLWSSVGFGIEGYEVYALTVDKDNNLYVGFPWLHVCADAACSPGLRVNRIAKWNGTTWSKLGQGFAGAVHSLVIDGNNNLYAGGEFWLRCNDESCNQLTRVNCIAQWNGTDWSKVGEGLDNWVYSLAVDDKNNLFAGGGFWNACANEACSSKTPAIYIAKWNGSTWSPLGSGIGPRPASVVPVSALAWQYGKLSVGGLFSTAGGRVSVNFAQYNYGTSTFLPFVRK